MPSLIEIKYPKLIYCKKHDIYCPCMNCPLAGYGLCLKWNGSSDDPCKNCNPQEELIIENILRPDNGLCPNNNLEDYK